MIAWIASGKMNQSLLKNMNNKLLIALPEAHPVHCPKLPMVMVVEVRLCLFELFMNSTNKLCFFCYLYIFIMHFMCLCNHLLPQTSSSSSSENTLAETNLSNI